MNLFVGDVVLDFQDFDLEDLLIYNVVILVMVYDLLGDSYVMMYYFIKDVIFGVDNEWYVVIVVDDMFVDMMDLVGNDIDLIIVVNSVGGNIGNVVIVFKLIFLQGGDFFGMEIFDGLLILDFKM